MSRDIPVDVLHEAAVEDAMDVDRAYFAAHPEAECYQRKGMPHEFCGTMQPGCVDVVGTVHVTAIADGVRAREVWGHVVERRHPLEGGVS